LPLGINGHSVIKIDDNKQIWKSLKYILLVKDLIRCFVEKYINEKKINIKKTNPNSPNSVKNW